MLHNIRSLDKNQVFLSATLITYLFQFENMLIEIILKLLICIIYTELFKTVGFKVFKSKNIKYANGQTLKEDGEISLSNLLYSDLTHNSQPLQEVLQCTLKILNI